MDLHGCMVAATEGGRDGAGESDIFSQCTDRGHVSTEGKMTDAKGEHADMCVSLSRANWLVHSHPDECTTGRAGEEKIVDEGEKTDVMKGGRELESGVNKQTGERRIIVFCTQEKGK